MRAGTLTGTNIRTWARTTPYHHVHSAIRFLHILRVLHIINELQVFHVLNVFYVFYVLIIHWVLMDLYVHHVIYILFVFRGLHVLNFSTFSISAITSFSFTFLVSPKTNYVSSILRAILVSQVLHFIHTSITSFFSDLLLF